MFILVLVGDPGKQGEKLAETLTVCEHSGEVRLGNDLVIEDVKFEGEKIKKLVKEALTDKIDDRDVFMK